MIKLTETTFKRLRNDYEGICVKCHFSWMDVEPDARGYECEQCGTRTVYGTEELLIMGRLEFVETSDEETVRV